MRTWTLSLPLVLATLLLPGTTSLPWSVTKISAAWAQAAEEEEQKAEALRLLNLCREHLGNEQAESALKSCQEAITVYQQLKDRSGEAKATVNLGIAYNLAGQPQQAIAPLQTGLDIAREIGDGKVEAIALKRLGDAYFSLGQYEEVIDFYQQSLVIDRETGNRQGEAYSLGSLGAAYDALGQYEEAIDFLQQSLTMMREIGNRQGEAISLDSLGDAYYSLKQYEEAIDFYQQHLVIDREIGNRAGEGRALGNLGNAHHSIGQYEQAIDFHQQSLAIEREIGNRQGKANALNGLGIAYASLGQYQKAIDFHQQSLAIEREIGNRQGEANALNGLGNVYHSLGQYEQAIDFHNQSLALAREINDRAGEGQALNNLGNAYYSLGQYEQAIDVYQQSLTMSREINDRAGEGQALNNLGNAYYSLGQYQKAADFYQQSLAITREIGDRAGESKALGNLGNVANALGLYEGAIYFHQQSLAIDREIGYRQGEAKTSNNLGLVYRSLRQYQKAIDFLQQALAITREIGDRATKGLTLSNIGRLLANQDQPELAIVFYKASVDVREAIRDDIRGLPQDQQQSFTETVADDYRALADLLLQQDRILEAQRVLDLLKVQELDDYLRGVRGNANTAQGLPHSQGEQQVLNGLEAILDQAMAVGKELTSLRQIQDRTAQQKQRLAQLVEAQEQITAEFNAFIRDPEVLALVQQRSPAALTQDLLLRMGEFNALRENLDKLGNAVLFYPLILEDRLELILTTPDSPPLRRTVAVSRQQLNQSIQALRRALQQPNTDATGPAQQLYTWLIKPLEADLRAAEAETLIYAPDGPLRYIPLAALHDGERWLVERYRVNNITAASLTDLNAQPSTQLQVLAGATTEPHQLMVGGESFDFPGLPFVQTELENLTQTLDAVTQLLDQAFNPDATVPKMGDHTVVHLATHGAFVLGQPEDSFLLFGDGSAVTLREMENWNLKNVDLVVLSACETGIGGKLGNGEEILGLGYQMQRAGARAAVASLWKVSDGGTQVLMNAFYAGLKEGLIKAEALRQAQIALIQGQEAVVSEDDRRAGGMLVSAKTGLPPQVSDSLDHPYYWAPFILIGNGL